MESKIILINVHTEYQLLSAISIIQTYFLDDNHTVYLNIIYPFNSVRFKFDWNTNVLNNVTVKFFDIDQYSFTKQKDLSVLIEFVDSLKRIDEFILFNSLSFVSLYFISKLKKINQSIKLSLGPDGAAAYTKAKRLNPRWAFFEFISLIKFFRANNVNFFKFHFPTLNYAHNKDIKFIYLQYPKLFKNLYNKSIIPYSLMANKSSVDISSQFFGFAISKFLAPNQLSGIYLYCNQPFYNQSIYEEELLLLNFLIKHNKEVVIKLHPSTEPFQLIEFKRLNLTLIESTFPAELFIVNLNNSKIISYWSTINLNDSAENTNYWLFPTLESKNLMNKNIAILNPSENIVLVHDYNDLL